MGIGLAALTGGLRRAPVLLCGLAAAGLINWLSAMHFVPTLSREASEAVADERFVAKVAPTLPDGSLVISHNPCMWQLQGVNASQFFTIDHMVHEELRELSHEYPGGIYVHWDYWLNAEPEMAADTAQLLIAFSAIEVTRVQSEAYKLALFRIDTPEAIARFGGRPPEPMLRPVDLDKALKQARSQFAPLGAPLPTQ
jgi:hypothetical protein